MADSSHERYFRNANISCSFAKKVWDQYKETGVDLDCILSLDKQGAPLRELMADPRVVVADVLVEVGKGDWDFERMISVEVDGSFGLWGTLSFVQNICAESRREVSFDLFGLVAKAKDVVMTKRVDRICLTILQSYSLSLSDRKVRIKSCIAVWKLRIFVLLILRVESLRPRRGV